MVIKVICFTVISESDDKKIPRGQRTLCLTKIASVAWLLGYISLWYIVLFSVFTIVCEMFRFWPEDIIFTPYSISKNSGITNAIPYKLKLPAELTEGFAWRCSCNLSEIPRGKFAVIVCLLFASL